MFPSFFVFSLGIMLAMSICCAWSKKGGDETFRKKHPRSRTILHTAHHWMFGLVLIPSSFLFPTPGNIFLLGLGLGLFIDDVVFHNFEGYFQRRN